ncbi:MAG: S8 family serine peptidase, partial [Anaerolineales bacterium]|nr:S8 family serine peptidase [Anaerolineales bacterium]
MKQKPFWIILFTFILANWAGRSTAASPEQNPNLWERKVDPQVMLAARQGDTEFLVVLGEQADLSLAEALKTKSKKGQFVYETLSGIAGTSQTPLLTILDRYGVDYHSFWVVNMIWVRGNISLVQLMAEHPIVAQIAPNPYIPNPNPRLGEGPVQPQDINSIEWNISQINAPRVWNLGYLGEGIVIGGQDTGYAWEHPALKEQYRGWDGGSADHNYNWHDTVTDGGGGCGPDTLAPCDDQGHGTHTMGIMVGNDGGTNQIGVAPGAQWIGCRNMNMGFGSPATYAECYQWFIAPTDLNGNHPDPNKAPHVINNSWGCPDFEGCVEPGILEAVVQAVRAAGIITVHSAGNTGSSCSTVDQPAAIYAQSFTVGATDSNDNITSFSSRGPVSIDGSSRLKPDVSAP